MHTILKWYFQAVIKAEGLLKINLFFGAFTSLEAKTSLILQKKSWAPKRPFGLFSFSYLHPPPMGSPFLFRSFSH